MTPEKFAQNEHREYTIYTELAKIESDAGFRKILEELSRQELDHYEFWKSQASRKSYSVNSLEIFFLKLVRKLLGLTFTVKYLEQTEKDAIRAYEAYRPQLAAALHPKLDQIIEDERRHEGLMIDKIKEERVAFVSSIVLGLNDGIIEITGAMVGFAFAFQSHLTVAAAGFIVGISASLSMASSAYLQARHESGKDPVKASVYTGISYFIVVLLLVSPFLLFTSKSIAIGQMAATVVLVLVCLSFFTSVVFERKFGQSLREMLTFSAGVAVVAFLIGTLARKFFGLEI